MMQPFGAALYEPPHSAGRGWLSLPEPHQRGGELKGELRASFLMGAYLVLTGHLQAHSGSSND
jgi:hypothetical protein